MIGLAAIACSGCYDAHVEPRTFAPDGSVWEGDAFTATSPSHCFPWGADTVVIGPTPGCVEVTVEGEGDGLDPIPASGRPIRFVDATGEDVDVSLDMQPSCPDSPTNIYMVTWLQEYCYRGESRQGECRIEERTPLPFDALAEDGILEALVGGRDLTVRFFACAIAR